MATKPYCVPTPGIANADVPLDPAIRIQSGNVRGEGSVSLNLETVVQMGSLASAHCHYSFGDGTAADACNPPTHLFSEGIYLVRLIVSDICGQTHERQLQVEVLPKKNTENKESEEIHVKKMQCEPSTMTGVIISEALPNPIGDDTEGEYVTLTNASEKEAQLCGWTLSDASGAKHALDDQTVAPYGQLQLSRHDTGIALNNDDETLQLFSSNGLVSVFSYTKSKEGIAVGRTEVMSMEDAAPETTSVQTEEEKALTVQTIVDLRTMVVREATGERTIHLEGIQAIPASDREDVTMIHTQCHNFLRALLLEQKFEQQMYAQPGPGTLSLH